MERKRHAFSLEKWLAVLLLVKVLDPFVSARKRFVCREGGAACQHTVENIGTLERKGYGGGGGGVRVPLSVKKLLLIHMILGVRAWNESCRDVFISAEARTRMHAAWQRFRGKGMCGCV